MPTYEYACKSCGRHIDVQQSFTDDPLTTCPTCAGQLRKVFGNIAISFKGTGFYSTDNRSVGKSGAANAKESESTSSSDGAKTDGASSSEGTSKSESAPSEGAKDTPKSGGSKTESGSGSGGSGSGSGSDGSKAATKSGDKSPAPAG